MAISSHFFVSFLIYILSPENILFSYKFPLLPIKGDRYSQIVEEHGMKYKEKHPNLDLKPNRSSPPWVISMERSSPSSSCVSREPSPDEEFSKKTAMSMMLMGCPG
ncbi:hypothetical protein P3S67_005412 [Capsicum chacoense]